MKTGIPEDQARRQAKLELGGIEQVTEKVRTERVGSHLGILAHDLRYTLRALRADPGFSIVVIIILALGIGATSALFSLVTRDLPFPEPDRLVVGLKTYLGNTSGPVSRVDYYDFLDQNRTFADLAATTTLTQPIPMVGEGEPIMAEVGWVTWNFFRTLGVEPVAGRSFLPEEAEPDAPTVVIISYSFWQNRYGGSPDLVGRTISVAGTPITVIGILPADYHFLLEADIWSLVDRQGPFDRSRGSHSHWLVGRLRPGVSHEQAQADLGAIAASLAEQYPDTNEAKGIVLLPLRAFLMFNARPVLYTLLIATVLVLLIACGNAAGLFLARGQKRLPELAVRSTLGASRSRLVRQLLTESLALTVIAGGIGVAVAWLLLRLLLHLLPGGQAGLEPPTLHGGVLLFTLGVSIVTGILVGVVPALRGSVANLTGRLAGTTRVSEHVQSTRLRGGFVVLQVALSVVLLISAGLCINSLVRVGRVDLGFDHEDLFTCGLTLSGGDYQSEQQLQQFFTDLLDHIRALPMVAGATMINRAPLLQPYQDWGVYPLSGSEVLVNDGVSALSRWVPPGYFETMRMPLIEGRDFNATDSGEAAQKIILSEDTARRLFPDGDPIGQQVAVDFTGETPFEVIGVVGDARLNGVLSDPFRAMYMPYARMTSGQMQLLVRGTDSASAVAGPVREIIRGMDRNLPLAYPATYEEIIADQLGGFHTTILAMGLFAALALILAAIGLYGVLTFHVRQRSRELGIRMVFGAGRSDIIGRVLRQGYLLVAIGLGLGLTGAAAATGLVRRILFQAEALDTAAYAGAVILFAAVAFVACLIPARRTLRIDPVESLRAE